MKSNKLKEKMTLHPIMAVLLLIGITILLSAISSLIGIQVTQYKINPNSLEYSQELIQVKNIFSLTGLKYIFTSTVENFVAFTPLSSLIIVLIGVGVMEKSGFLKTAFTLITKRAKRNTVTFVLVLTSILMGIIGDISYVILIPLSALLFKYGKRNPSLGIIASFAGLTCGVGINALFTSTDSALLTETLLSAHMVDASYTLKATSFIFIMLVACIVIATIITIITEKFMVEKLPKYEISKEEIEEEFKFGRREMRGLIFGCGAACIYLLVFIYNIVPGLPFSGKLLDTSQTFYIDKLFSYSSFFSDGFVFIVTMLFVILGLFYGIGAKTIRNNKDFCDDLGHSLDGTGKILVTIFFASALINIFKYSNIGNVLLVTFTNLLNDVSFTGIPLILFFFIIAALITLVVPSSIAKWTILAPVVVPIFMHAGMSAEFTQVIFRFAESTTMGLTPLMAYFVIYLAYLEKYNQNLKPINLTKTIRYQLPYSLVTMLALISLLIIWYITGLPIGIGSSAVL